MSVPQRNATARRWLPLSAAVLSTMMAATGLLSSTAAASSGANRNTISLLASTTPKQPELAVGPTPGGQLTTTYSVRSGDCLSDIATSHNIADWQQLYAVNRRGISNPDLIYPGQLLRLPTTQTPQ